MDRMNTRDQQNLIKSTEKVAVYTNNGLTPTDALNKVASEDQLTPIMITRAAEAFNRSRSVAHFSKTAAGDERALPFDLADPQAVIQNIYAPVQKTAGITNVPSKDFSKVGLNKPVIEKVANAAEKITVERLPKHSIETMIKKHASLVKRFTDGIHSKKVMTKTAFLRSIDRACDAVRDTPGNELKKVAQHVKNGYHRHGMDESMLNIITHKTRIEFPTVEKTANYSVFPDKEPYISINLMKDAAYAYYDDLEAETILAKEALDASALYEKYMRSRAISGPDAQATDVLMDIVDPKIINDLRKQRARTRIMELMLHDPDVSKYNVNQILDAYKSTVGSVPTATERPTVFKNLMTRNLESGGRKDLFELGQEAKLEQDIASPLAYGEKELL